MPLVDRARRVLAAVRGALVPPPPQVQLDMRAARVDHAEPAYRTYTRWTPADLRAAQVMADGGDLARAADLCEAILGDDRAPAVLNTRVNAVLGSELSFEAGRGRKKIAAVKALEAGEDWYSSFDEPVLAQLLLWGRLLGVSIAQLHWREFEDHGGRMLPVAANYHARHLRRDMRERCWKIAVDDSGREIDAVPGGGKWVIFTPYGENRPWAQGLWRGMARWWLLKQYAIDDWGRHSELHGQGIRVVEPPASGEAKHANKKLREELAHDIASLVSDGVVVLPPAFKLSLIEASANTWEMFRAQIDAANTAMSIMAIGTNLPTEVGSGAGTGATAQNLVRIDYKKQDAAVLSTCIHDQALVWWAEFNFFSRGLAAWPEWEVVPPADLKGRADLIASVAGSLKTFADAATPVDVPEILAEFAVPMKVVSEEESGAQGQIYKYHLDYGIFTKNEIRQRLGATQVPDGNMIPKPIPQPAGAQVNPEQLSALEQRHMERFALLGSPNQPRANDGKWTDGFGGGGASGAGDGGKSTSGKSGGGASSGRREPTKGQNERRLADRAESARLSQEAAGLEAEVETARSDANRDRAKAAAARRKADLVERAHAKAEERHEKFEAAAADAREEADDRAENLQDWKDQHEKDAAAVDKARASLEKKGTESALEKRRAKLAEAEATLAQTKVDLDESAENAASFEAEAVVAEKRAQAEYDRVERAYQVHRKLHDEATDLERDAARSTTYLESVQKDVRVARTGAELHNEHANLLRKSPSEYAAGVRAKQNAARSELQKATFEAQEFSAEVDRLKKEGVDKRDPRMVGAEISARRAAVAREAAQAKREFWLDRTDEIAQVIGPIDGDGDGKVNETEDLSVRRGTAARLAANASSGLANLTPDAATLAALRVKVARHNAGRRVADADLDALVTVWHRGVEALVADAPLWAMGRVNAYLARLSGGPDYGEDHDLMEAR